MRLGRLFWKFFFAFWLALLLAGLGVGSAVWLHRQQEFERLDAEREQSLAASPRAAMAVSAAASVLSHGGLSALRELVAEWSRDRTPRLAVVTEDGRNLLGPPVPPEVLQAAQLAAASHEARRPARQVLTPEGERLLLFVPTPIADFAPGFGPGRPPGPRFGPGRHPPFEGHPPEPSVFLPLGVGLFASIVFSALLAWHLSKPIRHLRWAFGAVAEGRLDTRVGPLMGARRDEVADLGQDFDRMAGQIQSLVGAQRRLLHDVSHELRSPLARLQAAIGLARQDQDSSRLEATFDRIERETMRLDELVGQILTLARLDAGSRDFGNDEMDLVDMTAAIADDARFEAQALGRDLSFRGAGARTAAVRGELIQRALENVIRNAVKYTRDGSTVEVDAREDEQEFRLTVSDRGPGVPEADLQAIFEPFYRGRNGHAADGFGLGLAIARRAVLAHGGRIQARNRDGGGLQVEIVLPLGLASALKD